MVECGSVPEDDHLVGAKERRVRHASGEREDTRCTESQGKSLIAQDGLCLLQQGWNPDGCA